jgi:uncharacterized membrane protein YdjX (TVP38/TMEM64 family)
LTDISNHIQSIAADYPIVLFFAIALLPAIGIPNCPLMIGGGAIVAAACGMPTAMAMAIGGVIANILWTYWVAALPLRGYLMRKIGDSAPGFVDAENRSVLMVTLLLHITPGVPLFIQNYYPGIFRLPYVHYLAIAIPVQTTYTALIVYTSGTIATRFNPAWTVATIGTLAIAMWLRSHVQRRRTVAN